MVKVGRHSKLYNAMRKAELNGRRDDFTISELRSDARDFGELQDQEYEEIIRRDTIRNGFNTASGGSIGTSRSIQIEGKVFPSHLAAADHYGVPAYNFNQRMQKLRWTAEQAAGLDPKKSYGKAVVVAGAKFRSVRSAAEHFGLDYKLAHSRLKKPGWSIEQAFGIAPPPSDCARFTGREVVTKHGTYTSIAAASRATGIKAGTIAKRLRDGWSPDEAVGLAPRGRIGNH